jgi:DNA-binding NarL/FixJ family response regulator
VKNPQIVIVDDCKVNSEGMAVLLSARKFEVGCAWDLPSLLERLKETPAAVVVLNIGARDSLTLLRVCLDMSPRTRVIVTGLSPERESEILFCAESGVAGLHLRTESIEDLATLIQRIDGGPLQSSTAVTAILLKHLYSTKDQPGPNSATNMLTAREREVLALLEEGLSNQQIASRLSVTLHTVKNHVHNVLAKLGVDSRVAAVAAARRMRLSASPGE